MKKNLLVLKFGGASLAKPESFRAVAELIREKKEEGFDVVVVASAMKGTTDFLIDFASQIHQDPPRREKDMLISVGERVSGALLAMALDGIGVKAMSYTGSQAGIITSEDHTNAHIIDLRPARIVKALEDGVTPVVAGFQGVSLSGHVTTLGRGGSDTSAVALAVGLGAGVVEFYKDAGGIYTQDPIKDPSATLLPKLSYEEASVIASNGGVLHPRCVKLAQNNQILLRVVPFDREKRDQGCETIVGESGFPASPACFENLI